MFIHHRPRFYHEYVIPQERTDVLPKCAFQIDSLLPEDRACINSFGIEPHTTSVCDGAEQMKVGTRMAVYYSNNLVL